MWEGHPGFPCNPKCSTFSSYHVHENSSASAGKVALLWHNADKLHLVRIYCDLTSGIAHVTYFDTNLRPMWT